MDAWSRKTSREAHLQGVWNVQEAFHAPSTRCITVRVSEAAGQREPYLTALSVHVCNSRHVRQMKLNRSCCQSHRQAGKQVQRQSPAQGKTVSLYGHLLSLHGSHYTAFWCRCSRGLMTQCHTARQYCYLQQTCLSIQHTYISIDVIILCSENQCTLAYSSGDWCTCMCKPEDKAENQI